MGNMREKSISHSTVSTAISTFVSIVVSQNASLVAELKLHSMITSVEREPQESREIT